MDDKKKWDFRNKVYVEDLVYKYGVESAYEHPSHPFLLNMDDKCWEEVFTSDLVDKIKSDGIFAVEDCNDACPDLYRWKIVDWIKNDGSIMDYTVRLWVVIDKVFANLFLAAKRDNSSVATTSVDTKNRVVSGIAPLPVLFREGNEYGAVECGKDDECGIGKKGISEIGLHSHKTMKKDVVTFSG